MTQADTNPYVVLGVEPTASPEDIKTAYFSLVRQHPPERDPLAFKRIRAAYEQLNTPEKRVEAEMRLLEEWPATSRSKALPEVDGAIYAEHVLALFKTNTDLTRTDFRADFREVRL